MTKKGVSLLLFTVLIWTSCTSARTTGQGRMTLNYIEYNRGKSFSTQSDLYLEYNGNRLTFHRVFFEDDSFYPDNSIIPNAFIIPLLQLRLDDAADAFTEPYYGFRFIHFFKKNPRLGIGLEFIHHKIFLNDHDQSVRVTGVFQGEELDQSEMIDKYIDYFSVSHGINHLALALVYRWMFYPSPKNPEGRLQPFVTLTAGPAIPHIELKLTETLPHWNAYSYQAGFRNFGLGMGMGLRTRPWKHFGFYLEYKIAYSHLRGMHFDGGGGQVAMDFFTHHIQWGISYIF